MPTLQARLKSQAEILTRISPYILTHETRKLVNRSGKRVRGAFPSLKAGPKINKYESLHELHVLQIMEVGPSILRVESQPFRLRFPVGAHQLTYTPDALVRLNHSPWIIILKAKGDIYLNRSHQIKKFRAIDEFLKANEIPFAMVLSSDLDEAMVKKVEGAIHQREMPIGTLRQRLKHDLDSSQVRYPEALENFCDDLLSKITDRDINDVIEFAGLNAKGVRK